MAMLRAALSSPLVNDWTKKQPLVRFSGLTLLKRLAMMSGQLVRLEMHQRWRLFSSLHRF